MILLRNLVPADKVILLENFGHPLCFSGSDPPGS